jgi:methyl-accepting chemotaxis protein
MSVFSVLLSTTNTININSYILNGALVIGSIVLTDLIFSIINPFMLKREKDVLDETYNTSSNKNINTLITYPFKAIPLVVTTELIGMFAYLIVGNLTNIIELRDISYVFYGLAFTSLFILIVTIFSQIYIFKIVTNTYLSKAIRKLNIVELKSIYIPIKYKLIGVFTIILISTFIVIAYAIFNNADRYIKESLYNDTLRSASLLADTIDNNTNADNIMKGMAAEFKGKYRFYLYNLNDKGINGYPNASLNSKIINELGSEDVISDTQNDQTLFSLHHPVLIKGNPYFIVIGVGNSLYRSILRNFISNIALSGIFIFLIVLITTFLISRDISFHEKKLANYSEILSEKNLSKLPELVSTDELGLISLNLRTLVKNFKESKIRTNESITAMNNLIGSTFKNISKVKSTIIEQSKYTDDLFGIINSIKDISQKITDLSVPFSDRMEKSSENISRALQRNKEIKSYVSSASVRISRTLKLIEKDINVYEDIKRSISKLKNTLLSIDSTQKSINEDTSSTINLLKEFTGSITNVKTLNDKGIELTKDIEVMLNETQNIADGILSLVSTFLSHIQQTEEVLGIINNVAERTNLLSVNAFILASSPQTEGKNFRVVAEEIKRLAGRARTGSKNISTYITKVRRNVDETFIGIKDISDIMTTVKQSINSINSINYRTAELSKSAIDISANATRDNEAITINEGDSGNLSGKSNIIDSVNKLIEDISTTLSNIRNIGSIFNGIKDTLANLTEINNTHYTTLTSISSSMEDIKTFIGYINDSLTIDIKEQVTFSSDSAKKLIEHIKGNEENIIDLDNVINQLIQELDLLKENINLFIV